MQHKSRVCAFNLEFLGVTVVTQAFNTRYKQWNWNLGPRGREKVVSHVNTAKEGQRHLPTAEAVGFGDILLHTSCGGVIGVVDLAVDLKFMANGVVGVFPGLRLHYRITRVLLCRLTNL